MTNQTAESVGQLTELPATPPAIADQLRDRVILITGVARGLGKAAAEACACAGATVILLDKELKPLEKLYDHIVAQGWPEPVIHPMNLEGVGPAEFLELATAIDQHFGKLDGLLHNAAFLGELSPMMNYDPEIWARVLHVNINAPFLLNHVCLPLMQRATDARLVFVSDAVGRRGKAFWGAYGASKAAVENMMETLSLELGRGPVKVMSFDPGAVDTAMRRKAYPAESTDGQRQPEDLAAWFVYLMGPDSGHLHGRRTRLGES
ncbi:MAG: SDR family NAD(P)-dependent oxidoreductase [Ectothiorhodospiraceae bacterium]|nr:SDR family NAD(P)-dependent oxidoreductase [Ectothiorhodospiraceae bacterium]